MSASNHARHGAEPGLAHQFEDLSQQHEAATLGMWLFIATEVMMFGGALGLWAVYRSQYLQGFAHAANLLDLAAGAFNTVVLLTSSLTMALAVREAALGRRRLLLLFLALTMLLGLVFLGVKVFEYGHKLETGLGPGPFFAPTPEAGVLFPRETALFVSFYFALTGLHALHMVVGVVLLAVIAFLALRGRYTPDHHQPVEIAGLYWHFVDIVWIFLFPLLYLGGRHGLP
jgi:cytochrome c oxidase subunit 3